MITVYHNGNALLLGETAAKMLGYTGGENLTEKATLEAIQLNARVGIAECNALIAERFKQ